MSFTQSRQLIVKAYYNDLVEQQPEIRRFAIDVTPNNDAYQALESTISQLNSNYQQGQFTLQYVDEDNDRITFSSDSEFRSALHLVPSGGVMKIFVKPKGQKTESGDSNNGSTVHPGVTCDGCQGSIVGNRYKCMQCPDFDLCQGCSDKKLHPEHNMIKISRPMPHPFGGFRRCGSGSGFRGRGPFGMGRCGGGPRFWRHFMNQQQQAQAGPFQMPPDMAQFLEQFNGKQLAEFIEAHLPEYLRTEKINETLNKFKTGEQADKPVDHAVLLEHVGQFLREILSPFGIDCDYFVDHPSTPNTSSQNNTEGAAKTEKTEESTASASASVSTEPKPSAPSSGESAAAPSFGNLLEQLQTMFVPMFQQGATAAANGTTTTAPPSQADQQAQEQKKIDECVERMTAMGFVDSNGILTELIKAKKGDLNQVLDALNPRNYQN